MNDISLFAGSISPGLYKAIKLSGERSRIWWALVQELASNPYIDQARRDEILKNGLGSHFRASA